MEYIHLIVISVLSVTYDEFQLSCYGSLLEVSIARRVELHTMEPEVGACSVVDVRTIIEAVVRSFSRDVCVGVVPAKVVDTCIGDDGYHRKQR